MRRKDRQLTDSEAEKLFKTCEYGILSTVCKDGNPYGVPLNFAYEDKCIYAHCSSAEGLKKENISFCNKACFTVVGSTQLQPKIFSTKYMSSIAFGKAEIVTDKAEKQKGIEAILKKYTPDLIEEGIEYIKTEYNNFDIIKLKVESFTGKGKK